MAGGGGKARSGNPVHDNGVFVTLRNGNVLGWYDVKDRNDEKGRMVIEHVEELSSQVKGEEHAFQVHFSQGGKASKWVLRGKTADESKGWIDTLKSNLQSIGSGDAFNYGLPTKDPRTQGRSHNRCTFPKGWETRRK
eukprot:gene22916-2194_t